MTFLRSYHRPAFKRRIMQGIEPAWLRKHKRYAYTRSAVLSFPYWVSRAALHAFDVRAAYLTRTTGVEHAVDHVIPISHPLVCGLTVPWNLQVITRYRNATKGNAWSEDRAEQQELFPLLCVEQYELPI